MVRVIDSTYQPYEKTKVLIGKDLEIVDNEDKNGVIGVYAKDKSNYWYFNKKGLQPLTPIKYNGRLVGQGDMVLINGRWCEVFGYYWRGNDEFRLSCAVEKDYSNCTFPTQEEIEDIRPLYTPKPEKIITVGGNKYQLIQE